MPGRSNEGMLIGLILAGFIVVALWMSLHNSNQADPFPPLSTYSPRPDGAQAIFELCNFSGLEPQRFHDTEYNYPGQACLVVIDKQDIDLSAMTGGLLNIRALRLWIEDGGRLVLFSAPLRSLGNELFVELDQADGIEGASFSFWDMDQHSSGSGGSSQVNPSPATTGQRLAGQGGPGQVTALWRTFEPGQQYELPADRPPLWRDVGIFETASPPNLPPVNGEMLLSTSNAADPVVIHRRFGAGEVIWVPRPEIVVNGWLNRGDNHRLVLALLAYAADGRDLYFDEHIHGYKIDRPSAVGMLFGTLGGRLLLALLGVGLLFLLGSAIRPARYLPQPIPPRRQAAEMVLAQADLYRRAGATRNAADSLVDGVKRAYMLAFHATAPPTDSTLADWLRTTAGLPASRTLAAYLHGDNLLGGKGLTDLARECDAIRHQLADGQRISGG